MACLVLDAPTLPGPERKHEPRLAKPKCLFCPPQAASDSQHALASETRKFEEAKSRRKRDLQPKSQEPRFFARKLRRGGAFTFLPGAGGPRFDPSLPLPPYKFSGKRQGWERLFPAIRESRWQSGHGRLSGQEDPASQEDWLQLLSGQSGKTLLMFGLRQSPGIAKALWLINPRLRGLGAAKRCLRLG